MPDQEQSEAAPNPADHRKWWIFITVSITTVMATLDASIVNIAIPVIRSHFSVDIIVIEWVVVAYLLTITSLLMIFGRMADLYGRKKLFILGIIVFTAGSAFCAFSQSITALILSRILQGIGASCVTANGLPIITATFPPHERGKALGWVVTSVAFGLSAGPVLGGVLTTYLGWRYIFLINLPIGIAALTLAQKFLTESPIQKNTRFDLGGSLSLTIALISLLLAFTQYQNWGLSISIALLLCSTVFFYLFIVVEKKFSQPMIDLDLFKDDRFTLASLAAFLNFAGRFSIIFLFPFYLVDLRGFEPSSAGLLMTPIPLCMALAAPYSGALSDKIGTRLLTTLGMIISAVGFVVFVFIDENSSLALMLSALILMGIGGGIFGSPNTSTIMGSVPKSRLGNAGAISALVRNLGMIVGITWSGVLFHALTESGNGGMMMDKVVPAFSAAMKISVLILLAAALASFKRSEITIAPGKKP